MRMLQVMPKVRIGLAVAVIALGALCLGVARGQGSDDAEPINGVLKRISSQIGQLRQITLSSSHVQKDEAGEIRKQLNQIDRNIQQLEEVIALQDQSSQHRLDQLESANRWLIAAIGLLAVIMLYSMRRNHEVPVVTNLPAEQPKQNTTDDSIPDTPPLEAPAVQQPETFAKLHIGNLVAEDIEQTHQTLIEAQRGFMKPADTKKLS